MTLYLKCKNIKATPHNKRVGLQNHIIITVHIKLFPTIYSTNN